MYTRQEIEILKQKIAELEKELEKAQEKKYPDKGTSAYTVTPLGEVWNFIWRGFNADEEKALMLMFDSGELFLTKEGAEEYAEVKQIEREVYALADGDKEWNKLNAHWSLCYDIVSDDIDYFLNTSVRRPVPYFASRESLTVAVEKVGKERVIKWLTYKRTRGNNK